MKYEKAISKLEKFTELNKEKQVKLLKKILTDEEMLKWQFDPGQNKQPYTGEMFNKLYKAMAMPAAINIPFNACAVNNRAPLWASNAIYLFFSHNTSSRAPKASCRISSSEHSTISLKFIIP